MFKKLLVLIFITSFSVSFSQEQYYSDVDLELDGINLKDALASKITSTHTNMLDYTPDVWEASKITDKDTDPTKVVLIYGWEDGSDQDVTNDRTRDNSLQDTGSGESFKWNREHVYSRSLANPNLTTNQPGPGTDAHNLRPADRNRNTERSNFKFGEGSGNSGFSQVTYAGNRNAWYPGDEWKGDVARMMMYMYVRYDGQCLPTGVGVGDTQFTPDDMIDLFLKWNVEDKVSAIEIARNTYHEDTANNNYAQGNRNPFIDNPYLATRIWGGDSAEDSWGIYTSSDTEAPTPPTNVTASNNSTTTIDLSWNASSDNIEVTGYNVYVDGILNNQTANTTIQVLELKPSTNYAFTIEARDMVNNKSEKSTVVNSATLEDNTAPSVPTNVVASTISGTTFKLNWNTSTDDTAIDSYDIFIDNVLNATTTDLSYTVTDLTSSTTYVATVSAKDAAGNTSAKSTALNVTTSDGASNGITELFISEYIESDGGYNKAIEIVNLTSATVSLAGYTLKKQSNGDGDWINELDLSSGAVKAITTKAVFVIINEKADKDILVNEADLVVPNNGSFPYGAPANFNGNDPVGLFKNGVLIDIVGEKNNSNFHIEDVTLRRKSTISSPSTTYDIIEWDSYAANTFDDIGSHTSTLSTSAIAFESFKMFPNPTNGNRVYFSATEDATVRLYTVLGKLVHSSKVTKAKNSIDISKLATGMYLLKIKSGAQLISKKLIKN